MTPMPSNASEPTASPMPAGITRPLTGGGLVACANGLLLVCDAPDEVTGEVLKALRAVDTTGGTGHTLTRSIVRTLAAERVKAGPGDISVATAGPADGGFVLLVGGAATARVTTPEGEVVIGSPAEPFWVERFIAGPVNQVELCLPGAAPADPRCRLEHGVMPGGGIVWSRSSTLPASDRLVAEPTPAPPEPAPPEPAPPEPVRTEPADTKRSNTEQFRTERFSREPARTEPADEKPGREGPTPHVPIPAAESAPERTAAIPTSQDDARSLPPRSAPPQPAQPTTDGVSAQSASAPDQTLVSPEARPEVWGGECTYGHFNDPRAHFCAVCGISMAQLTIVPRRGPRPPLGMLLLDDGTALRLDTDHVIGRAPERAAQVVSGTARPMRVNDAEGSVSRRHLHVQLYEWDVRLIDLGSVNGTYVMAPGEQEFQQITSGQPVTIEPGTKVRLGASRTLIYESHRNQF